MFKKASPLLALSSAAMALPAFSASQPPETEVSFLTTQYREGSIASDRILSGAEDRYDIDINQFRLLTPVRRSWSFGLDVGRETMSGASPWGTFRGVDGEPSLVMSGATIVESRTEVNVTAGHYWDSASASLTLSRSEEDDYEASGLGIAGEWDLNAGLTTLALGVSYSSDDLAPTDAAIFGRVPSAAKHARSANFGVTQVLNQNAALQSSITVTRQTGFLSDPYKLRDVRPEERTSWAVNMNYRRWFDAYNAALHFDYRYYNDDFGIDSHTLETAWYQTVAQGVTVAPRIRYYIQGQADFYLAADDFALPLSVPQSSDHRLSSYGAMTVGLTAAADIRQWNVSLSVDRYIADENYDPGGSDGHPALLDFTMVSLGFSLKL